MSDPKRLFEEGGDLAREVLGSAKDDRPSDAARRRAAIALGISVVSSATAASSASAASSAPVVGAPSAASSALSLKWVLAAIITGGAATSAVLLTTPTERAPAPALAVPSPVPAPIVTAAPMLTPIKLAPPITPAPRPTRPSVPVPSPAPVRAPPLDLAGEVSILDRAKVALAAHEPSAALEALDAYDRAGGSALEPEARALRIDALVASSDHAAAKLAAQAFVARYPSHRLSLRYRALAEAP